MDMNGHLSVSEGILDTALEKYYGDVDEKVLQASVKSNIEMTEKAIKQKLSDKVKEQKEEDMRKSFELENLYADFIKIDDAELQKEFLAGYMVKQGIYTKAVGDDADQSNLVLQAFKKDAKKIKTAKDVTKLVSKYVNNEYLTVGTFTVTKDISIFDTKVDKTTTEKVLKADVGDLIVFNNSKNGDTKKDNYIYITDSWKASQSQILQYKQASYKKDHLNSTVDILKALAEKHKDFKIDKDYLKKLEGETKGKYIVETTADDVEKAFGTNVETDSQTDTAKEDSESKKSDK